MRFNTIVVILFCMAILYVRLDPAAAQELSRSDSLKAAVETLQQAIKLKPDNPDLHLSIGYIYLEQERWGRAIGAFKRCLNLTDTSAMAHNGLGLAYHGRGEGIFIPIERLKQLFRIDNYSKAEKSYRTALELNPNYLDPLYNMGVNYIVKGGNTNYNKSVQTLKTVMVRDSLYKEAGLMLGNAYRHLKDYDNAEAEYRKVIATERHLGKALVRLSEIYLDTDRNEEATEVYYDGIRKIRDRKFWENIYAELNPLMTDWEKREYRSLPVEEKGAFIRKFWKRRDPTPTTHENERFVEHFRRVLYAVESFPDIVPPYYDDRGKIFVKYGVPDARHVSDNTFEQVYRNESWTYEKTIRTGLTFDFVQKGHSFRLVQDLSEAAPAGLSMANRRVLASNLYNERSDFTDSYQRFSTGEIDNNLIDFHAERSEAVKKSPPESYSYKLPGKALPFVFNLAQFRAPENDTRTEVYMGVSSSNLKFTFDDGRFKSDVTCDVLVRDTTFEDLDRHEVVVTFESSTYDEVENKLLLIQDDVHLPSGEYALTLHMKNQQGQNQGLYSTTFKARDFRGDHLMLSDVQLASHVVETSAEGEFIKSGYEVTPYPYTVIRKGSPIYVYFEIYNLRLDPSGQTRFKVDYKIKLVERKRSFISRTVGAIGRIFTKGKEIGISTSYEQTGNASFLPQYIALDMNTMPDGMAEFVITIEDQVASGKAAANVQFQLIE